LGESFEVVTSEAVLVMPPKSLAWLKQVAVIGKTRKFSLSLARK